MIVLQRALDSANIPLVYFLVVLLCATTAGLRPAILSAIGCVVADNFFFVPPIHTLHVDQPQDMLRLVLFLITASIGGGLTARVRERADVAGRRTQEVAALYQLSQLISIHLDFASVAPQILTTAMALLGSQGARLVLATADGARQEIAQAGVWSDARLASAPLRVGDETLGWLETSIDPPATLLDPDHQRLLETLASQAALAFQRSQLVRTAALASALAESDRLKSALLSAVSHDFRTPLAAIIAAADEVLSEDVAWSPAAIRTFGMVIAQQANHLNYLITNLLDLSRIEAGMLRPRIGWYNIAEIIEKARERLDGAHDGRQIAIAVPDDLPLVPVDYVQIEQVIWNILQNAVTYTPRDTPILITAQADGDHIQIAIADQGPGIPASERQKVFEKFYRLQGPRSGHDKGMGIGLAICKGLIDAHHGEIEVQGRTGGGTRIHVRLPLGSPTGAREQT